MRQGSRCRKPLIIPIVEYNSHLTLLGLFGKNAVFFHLGLRLLQSEGELSHKLTGNGVGRLKIYDPGGTAAHYANPSIVMREPLISSTVLRAWRRRPAPVTRTTRIGACIL
jgi:hypothetical protein